MAKDNKYGFGVLGCGVISDTHLDAIAKLPNAETIAVCDRVEEAAKSKAEKYGCEYYVDLDEMLKDDRIDVVNVVVPSGLHAPLGIQCADAGKHVICTKPIDVTLEKIDALIEAGERNNVKIGATHQFRGYTIYKKIKNYAETGKLGKLLYGNAKVPWYRTDEYYSDGWHGTKKLDGGGALMNQSIHYVDLLIWIMGDVEVLGGFADALDHDMIEVEDCATAALKFTSGAQGVIQGTTCTYQGHPAELEIHGTKGNIITVGEDIRLWEVEGEDTIFDPEAGEAGGAAKPEDGMKGEAVDAHTEQIGDLLDAVENDREPKLSAREARRAVEVILKIYESSETGRMVRFD
ncbi:MAG: Gfo/Idh/MocA family oxidoreductase [Armatimonadota bacterium]